MAAAVSDTPTLLAAAEKNAGAEEKMPQIRLTPTFKLLATPKVRAADNKRKFACPYADCDKSYGKSSHLRSHLTWHSGIKPFVCQEPNCGRGFTRSDELNRHTRTHSGEKPFECTQCPKRFSRSDHMKKHLATHSKQTAATTTTKSAVGKTQNNRNKSYSDTNESQIEHERDTPTPPLLHFSDGMHFMAALIRQSPSESALDSALIKEETQLQDYDVTTTDAESSKINIKLEHNELGSDYQMVQLGTTELVPSKAAMDLANVLQLEHMHTLKTEVVANDDDDDDDENMIVPDTQLHCPLTPELKYEPNDDDTICPEANGPPLINNDNTMSNYIGEPFSKKPCYDNDDFPYTCNECARGFKRQDCLNRHKRTHSGEKPYLCQQCDKRFTRSDHLKKHVATHNRAR